MRTLAAIVVLSVASFCAAQEVLYVDLVRVTPRVMLREPPASPTRCTPDGQCTGGFNHGTIIGDVGVGVDEPRAVRISLTSLDSVEYSKGSTAEIEFKVENVGRVSLQLPVSPHVADLQPKDETRPFEYEELSLVLQNNATKPLSLYGNQQHPHTLVTIKPGEWIRVRGRAEFALSDIQWKNAAAHGAQPITGEFWLHHVKFVPQPGGSIIQVDNIYPRHVTGDAMTIRFRSPSGDKD
jgi:hypothetical protein